MNYRVLIPVKALHAAKSRLAAFVPLEQREHLVLDMLHHVVTVLQRSGYFERISIVSPDPYVLQQVRYWGAYAVAEEQQGHNPALHAAALHELHAGTAALLTMSADLPLLENDDIEYLIEAAKRYDVVLAPSREGTGTNALLVQPPLAIPYLFGVNSLQTYLAQTRRQRMTSTLCISRGLSWDIDTIDDLEQLQRYQQANEVAATAHF